MHTEESKEKIKNSVGRAVLVVFSILLQIGWIMLLTLHIFRYNTALYILSLLLGWIVALRIYGMHMNAAYKFSWMILILAFPILGLSLYLFFGSQLSNAIMRRKFQEVNMDLDPHLKQNLSIVEELQQRDRAIANQAYYIQHSGGYPVYTNTDVKFYGDTVDALNDLKLELRKAEKFIFMEYHAIEDSVAWAGIEQILAEKAAAGVDVRVFYDDMGSIGFLSKPFTKRLQSKGIQCRVFNPVRPIVNVFMNNRDHRKITVIDGKVGFTGGYNLADEYFNYTHPYGQWKDTGIKLTGDAVRSLTLIFFEMWNVTQKVPDDPAPFLPPIQYQAQEHCFVQPYADSPLRKESVGENVYQNIIKNAKRYVYITTPYLIIDDEMERELTLAARRGVDVRIITPGIPDKKLVFKVTRSYYARLAAYGVRIFEYTPGFMHAKQFVCDDEVAAVGTINLDFRSLYLHFENGCWLYGCQAVQDVKADFDSTFPICTEVTEKYSVKRNLALRGWQLLLRLFSPLM